MAAELKELNRERSVRASDMNKDALQIYEELLKRKNGIAVAGLRKMGDVGWPSQRCLSETKTTPNLPVATT